MVHGDVIMSHEEEDMLRFSSLLGSDLHPQLPNGEKRARRWRKKAKGGEAAKKRRLSDEQVKFLEMRFGEEKKLEFGRKLHLAAELGLDPKQVAVWFQNRRARHKSKQVEDAYLQLKSLHHATTVEKCHLENEVLKLKEKLLEAEEEIRKLSLVTNGATAGGELIGSPSSSTLTYQQPLVLADHFGVVGEAAAAELMQLQEYDFDINYMTDWANNFYGI